MLYNLNHQFTVGLLYITDIVFLCYKKSLVCITNSAKGAVVALSISKGYGDKIFTFDFPDEYAIETSERVVQR